MLMLLQLNEGSGSILVVAVGVNTEYGKTMSLVMTESASTPLQEHLEVLATSIGKVGLAVAIVCFSVLLIRLVLAMFPCTLRSSTFSSLSGLPLLINLLAIAAITLHCTAMYSSWPLDASDKMLVCHIKDCSVPGYRQSSPVNYALFTLLSVLPAVCSDALCVPAAGTAYCALQSRSVCNMCLHPLPFQSTTSSP